MSKIILAVALMFSAVSFAEEVRDFPNIITQNYKCSQMQMGLQNRGYICAQSSLFPAWCTMHVASAWQCMGNQVAQPSYAATNDTKFCQLGFVCVPRGNDGGN